MAPFNMAGVAGLLATCAAAAASAAHLLPLLLLLICPRGTHAEQGNPLFFPSLLFSSLLSLLFSSLLFSSFLYRLIQRRIIAEYTREKLVTRAKSSEFRFIFAIGRILHYLLVPELGWLETFVVSRFLWQN